MRDQGKFLGGILLGIGIAYLLDPDRGARRRAIVRDKASSAGRRLTDNLDATTRDLRNRVRGGAAELRARFRREDVDDAVLQDRVRSAIGRVLSQASAIDLDVVDGCVTLRGQVPADEAEELRSTVKGVRGVVEVIDEVTVRATPDRLPSLQSEGTLARG